MPWLIACSANPTATVLRYFILGVKLSLIAYYNAMLGRVFVDGRNSQNRARHEISSFIFHFFLFYKARGWTVQIAIARESEINLRLAVETLRDVLTLQKKKTANRFVFLLARVICKL